MRFRQAILHQLIGMRRLLIGPKPAPSRTQSLQADKAYALKHTKQAAAPSLPSIPGFDCSGQAVYLPSLDHQTAQAL